MTTAPLGFLRVAAACPPVRVADPEANVDATLACIEQAASRGAQVLVLPELGLTGYTCGDLFFGLHTLVGGAERALERLLRGTAGRPMVIVAGLPVQAGGRLYNAAAVLQSGQLRGVVPKTFLPGYQEYYEERWFSSSRELRESSLRIAGAEVPFGTDLLFEVPDEPGVTLAVEICEDLWAPIPPSCHHAVAGATVILNPSAGNDLVAKAEYRRQLVAQQSARTLSAYAYANAGVHESTTDVVFGGQLLIAENGIVLAEGERFRREGELVAVDVDTERLRVERVRQTSFADAVHGAGRSHRVVALAEIPAPAGRRLLRQVEPHPFVPGDPATVDERCREVFSIQTAGLARRVEHTGTRRLVLGLSGGLDSTLALLVCARTLDLLQRRRGDVLAVTMPGFGTTARTLESARRLASAWGAELREIDIRPACDAAHPRHRPRSPGPSERDLPEPAGARAHPGADGPRQQGGRDRGRHRRPLGAGARLRHLRRRPDRDVQRQRQRAQDARAPPGGLGGGPPLERGGAGGAAGRARHAGLARARPAGQGRRDRPEDRGPDRPVRAPRLLPLQLRAPGRRAARRSCTWPATPSTAATTRRRCAAGCACSSSASSRSSSSAR